ncbi:MAG: YggT family protein [Nitrospirae bacterium]|nr:YggT family protein [Nitrospirota bacterium]
MFIVSNLIKAIATILDLALTVYMWIIIIAALISWVSPDPYNPIVRFLYRATEPVLRRIRRVIPVSGLGIDVSPMIAILGILFLKYFIIPTLVELAYRIKTI